VILGFESTSGYDGTDNKFFWGTTGRLTNRVKDGKYSLDGKLYQLSLNDFGNSMKHHVHGGFKSFDRLNWNTQLTDCGVIFSVLSEHASEGYPGNLVASVEYTLDDAGSLDIKMKAFTDAKTVVNLSNHVYINLAGHASGWEGLQQHTLCIPHAFYTPDDDQYLPTGEIEKVSGTTKDFQSPKKLVDCVPCERDGEGYCVNYCIENRKDNDKCLAAVLSYPPLGRELEVWSDQPGLELYTGNFLPSEGEELEGKGGARYGKWGGVCLMTQNYRDAPNHANFPSAVLSPGELYTHNLTYKFIQK